MKRSILLGTLCVIACIFYSSCGSNLSITKRHYRNGYYVDHDKEIATTISKEKKTQTELNTAPVPRTKEIEQNEVSASADQNPGTDETVPIEENKKELTKREIALPVFDDKVEPSTFREEIRERRDQIKATGDTSDDSGLSLFWIIILVLLILWALGFISGGFGLGGLIHVLLVIALILLILWLLKII